MKLSLPVIASQIGQITVGIADNVMIGRYGSRELASASFANTLFTLLMIFGMGFAISITPLIGEAYAKKDDTTIARWIKHGFFLNSGVGMLLIAISFIVYFFMPYMGQPQEILHDAQEYFLILSASLFPLMIFLTGKQAAEGMRNTKVAMIITLSANIVNIIFNYLLIYGKFGCAELGLNGAGIGTLIARVFMAAGFVFCFYKKPDYRSILSQIKNIDITSKSFKRLTGMGVPMGFQLVAEASAFIIATIMMGWLGTKALAAHQIAFSLTPLGFMIYQGIGVSNTIRISNILGRQIPGELSKASKASVHITMVLVIGISIFLYLTKDLLPRLYTNDQAIIEHASKFIVMMIVFQLFDAFQIIYSGTLRGMSDVKVPGVITFISYFLIATPVSYFAAFHWGFNSIGIWMGFPVGLGFAALLFFLRFRKLLTLQEI